MFVLCNIIFSGALFRWGLMIGLCWGLGVGDVGLGYGGKVGF